MFEDDDDETLLKLNELTPFNMNGSTLVNISLFLDCNDGFHQATLDIRSVDVEENDEADHDVPIGKQDD